MYGIRHAWAKKVAKKIEFMTKEFGIFCYKWKRGIKKRLDESRAFNIGLRLDNLICSE